MGGRTGCRTRDEVRAVAQAVRRQPSLMLIGVAGWEGPFGHGRDESTFDGYPNIRARARGHIAANSTQTHCSTRIRRTSC